MPLLFMFPTILHILLSLPTNFRMNQWKYHVYIISRIVTAKNPNIGLSLNTNGRILVSYIEVHACVSYSLEISPISTLKDICRRAGSISTELVAIMITPNLIKGRYRYWM